MLYGVIFGFFNCQKIISRLGVLMVSRVRSIAEGRRFDNIHYYRTSAGLIGLVSV